MVRLWIGKFGFRGCIRKQAGLREKVAGECLEVADGIHCGGLGFRVRVVYGSVKGLKMVRFGRSGLRCWKFRFEKARKQEHNVYGS